MILYMYPKCTTCIKAKKYLDEKNINYEVRDITTETPTKEELDNFIRQYHKDVNKFFNTSGLKYRSLNLKEKIKNMTYDEKIELLSSDGMLIKRPLLIEEDAILIGFKEKEWNETI